MVLSVDIGSITLQRGNFRNAVERVTEVSLWKIVDANTLRRPPLLEDFFRADPANLGLVTDFCCMECYKGADPVANLTSALSVLSRYPSQVAVLRNTPEVVALTGGRTVSREDIIDPAQTGDFAQFCKAARLAKAGNRSLIGQIHDHAAVANKYLAQMATEAAGVSAGMQELARELPTDLTTRLRRNEQLPSRDLEMLISGIVTLSAAFFEQHPDFGQPPASAVLPSTFIFRYSLACYLLTIRWIADGGVENAKPNVLANDVVDMNYVAFAPYFDGVLSLDRKVLGVYEEASLFLQTVFR